MAGPTDMSNDPQIVLLDLDGTLIYPGGYRAAYAATLRDLLAVMNLDPLWPEHEIQEHFESLSVNSEWDMLPITVAILLEVVYQALPQLAVPGTLSEAIEQLRQVETSHLRIDYREYLTRLMPYLWEGETPSIGVLNSANGIAGTDAFPRLGRTDLLADLLLNTRDVDQSLVVRMFQTYVLGGQLFCRTYGVPPQFECESFLEKYDKPLISQETARTLLRMNERGELRLAILTCRPSRPPKELWDAHGASPSESEIAVTLLDMCGIPLIGYGHLQYLAAQHGTQTDRLMKPSPVHALAAIGAAWTGQERAPLEWAYQIHTELIGSDFAPRESEVPTHMELPLPRRIHLHVFEDMPTGILSARAATRVLERCGLEVRLDVWGIADNEIKRAALVSCGARLYSTSDEAFREFLNVGVEG